MNQLSDDQIVLDRPVPSSRPVWDIAPRRRGLLRAVVDFFAFSVIGAGFQGARSADVQTLMASMNDNQLAALGLNRDDLETA